MSRHSALFTRLRRLRSERGFTVIEILMAALVAAIGIAALVATLSSSRSLVSGAERNETATHEAEQEIERLAALPYAQLGTTTAPASSADETDPRFWVRPGNKYRWNQTSTTQDEDLVIGGSSSVPPSGTWSDGESRLGGEIWRFVTHFYDPYLIQSPDVPDGKRITVAITLDGAGAPTEPILVSSIRRDTTTTPDYAACVGDADNDECDVVEDDDD